MKTLLAFLGINISQEEKVNSHTEIVIRDKKGYINYRREKELDLLDQHFQRQKG